MSPFDLYPHVGFRARLRRVSTDSLPVKALLQGRISLVTNWAGVHTSGAGLEGCELAYHVPVEAKESTPYFDHCIVFQPRGKGTLAVACQGIGLCQSVEAIRSSEFGRCLGAELAPPSRASI